MEQIRGTGTDARSDLYSLGATLYQLLTGKTPADALTRADDLLGSKPDPLHSLTEMNTEVTPAISETVLRSMSVRQDERFGTAAEMQKALRRAYNQARTAPPPDLPKQPDLAAAETLPRSAMTVDTSSSTSSETTPGVPGEAMESTLRMAPNEMETVIRQADIKTETFKAPEVVVPVVVPGSSPVTPEPQSVSESKEESVAAEPAKQAINLEKTEVVSPASAPLKPPPAQPGSRTGLYIGIFVILFVVGGLAAGGGWYAYTRYQTVATPTPAPTIEAIAAPSAPPNTSNTAPTPDLTEANTNTSPTNTQTTSGPGPQRTNGPVSKDVPGKTNPGTAPKTPPKTKGKDDRTVILQ